MGVSERGERGGGEEGGKKRARDRGRENLDDNATTARPGRKEEKMENGGRGMGQDESVGDVRMC